MTSYRETEKPRGPFKRDTDVQTVGLSRLVIVGRKLNRLAIVGQRGSAGFL